MSVEYFTDSNVKYQSLKFQYLKIAYTKEGKIQYGKDGIKYATEGSAGFDLKACDILYNFTEPHIYQDQDKKYYSTFYNKVSDDSELYYIARYKTQNIDTLDFIHLCPKGRILIKTGIKVAIPKGFCLQITPRSGLALKHGITITNSPGIIDSDYRGEIGIILHNLGNEPFEIKLGDRIGQAVLVPVTQASFQEITEEEFEQQETERGDGGFGSTGK
jgi:dUTP pyrophosphatase